MSTIKTQTNFDFNRILISRFISGIGDWGGLIAISNLSYNSTHSVKNLSIIYVAKIFAILFSSVVQNKILSKISTSFLTGKLLAIFEFISALSLISIVWIEGLNTISLALIYFTSAICSSVFLSLTSTLITELYPSQYKDHFRIFLFSKRAAFLLGPLAMGISIGFFGNRFGIIADAISFMISGMILKNISIPVKELVKSDSNIETLTVPSSALNSESHTFLLATLIIILVGIVGGAVNSIELPYIVTQLNLESGFFGLSLALGGIGSITGLLVDLKIPKYISTSKLIYFSIVSLLISFIPWYFNSKILFSFSLILFGFSITIFSNRTLFYFIDCYNESSTIRKLFKNKPYLFLFYHQVDSLSMIIGAILSGLIADAYTTKEAVHLIIACLMLSLIANFMFNIRSSKRI